MIQFLIFALISVCYARRLLKDLDFENDSQLNVFDKDLNLNAPILEPIKLPNLIPTLEPQPRINIYEIEI